jgi:hypothetical protein
LRKGASGPPQRLLRRPALRVATLLALPWERECGSIKGARADAGQEGIPLR